MANSQEIVVANLKTQRDAIIAAKNVVLDKITNFEFCPSYSIDGQSVDMNGYLHALNESLKNLMEQENNITGLLNQNDPYWVDSYICGDC